MKKHIKNFSFSEKFIIDKFLKKLNYNKKGTFNFENDAAFIEFNKNKKIVITTDSISEKIDFFKNDDPRSIANKIVTINLSDLSSMGVDPYAYSLNLFLPKYINTIWLKIFSNELFKLQNKYKFYLVGGDLSKSDKLIISATFYGLSRNNIISSQKKISIGDDIWLTGNLGESFIGLQMCKKKINIKDNTYKKYFYKKYFFPKPCLLGPKISKYARSITDVSDGFIGDLKKMLNNTYGAKINLKNMPISENTRFLIKKNKIKLSDLLNCGDDYELIVIADKKYRNKIFNLAKINKVKISHVGEILQKLDFIFDSAKPLNIARNFDHFL